MAGRKKQAEDPSRADLAAEVAKAVAAELDRKARRRAGIERVRAQWAKALEEWRERRAAAAPIPKEMVAGTADAIVTDTPEEPPEHDATNGEWIYRSELGLRKVDQAQMRKDGQRKCRRHTSPDGTWFVDARGRTARMVPPRSRRQTHEVAYLIASLDAQEKAIAGALIAHPDWCAKKNTP